jgi:hypothetical protein
MTRDNFNRNTRKETVMFPKWLCLGGIGLSIIRARSALGRLLELGGTNDACATFYAVRRPGL